MNLPSNIEEIRHRQLDRYASQLGRVEEELRLARVEIDRKNDALRLAESLMSEHPGLLERFQTRRAA